MLILTRKSGESITIGDDVKITVVEVKGSKFELELTHPEVNDPQRGGIPEYTGKKTGVLPKSLRFP
ncbi:MAG: hypothetical protein CM1200mP28_05730 [Deltaproteobacteria bacterium]|nr:MAG: hypothetical protein CM1200mP28_05730 [Deltaproteobacteria bacterium]